MRVACVGALVRDDQGRLLVVRRGRPPGVGLWSVPGGRVEPGETDAVAVRREVLEETGLAVAVGALVGSVERAASAGDVFLIRDFACRVEGGRLAAGDDAVDVRFATYDEMLALPTVPGLVEALAGWGWLPA